MVVLYWLIKRRLSVYKTDKINDRAELKVKKVNMVIEEEEEDKRWIGCS